MTFLQYSDTFIECSQWLCSCMHVYMFAGETLKHNMWSNGEPSNSTRERSGDSGEYCVSVFRNLKLNDVYCHVPMPFLCEKSPFSLL